MKSRHVDPRGIVPLTRGLVALVSPEDVPLVSRYNWSAHSAENDLVYAQTSRRVNGRKTLIQMHRLILNASRALDVDHVNHDGLDNRRENIRLATGSQNSRNRRRRGSVSSFKGVWAAGSRWRAEIKDDAGRHYLGVYRTAEEAARVYDRAARQFFGDFAHLNFPDALEATP